MKPRSLVYTIFLVCVCSFAAIVQGYVQCSGTFDVYFVLDRSASTGANYQQKIIPFVRKMTDAFDLRRIQVSIIWFGTGGNLELPLTADFVDIQNTLNRMENEGPPQIAQATNIGAGLEQVELREGVDVNKLVFVISDGCDTEHYKQNTINQARKLKQNGAELYVIYIPSGASNCPEYLQAQVAGTPVEDHWFPIEEALMYEQLQRADFMDAVISKSCLEIYEVTPDTVCGSYEQNILVRGKGFLLTDDLSKFACRFQECKDNDQFVDSYGMMCRDYNPNMCTMATNQYELGVNCPVACGVCDTHTCVDVENSISCETMALMEGCGTDYMRSYCMKTCNQCGQQKVPAFVLSDNELICKSPYLTPGTKYSFEITRNNITWTQNYHEVGSTYCDAPPVDTIRTPTAALGLYVDHSPMTYNNVGTPIQFLFQVKNEGEVALNGQVQVESNLVGTYCPAGILAPQESMICEGVYVTTQQDIERGKVSQRISAKATSDNELISTQVYRLTVNSDFYSTAPTKFPTTTSPTFFPTRAPTSAPTTSFPTSSPTAMPSASPTPRTASPSLSTFAPSLAPSVGPTANEATTEKIHSDDDTKIDSDGSMAPTPVEIPEVELVGMIGAEDDSCSFPPTSIACVPGWMWAAGGAILLLPLLVTLLCCSSRKQKESASKNEILNGNPYESATPSLTPNGGMTPALREGDDDGELLFGAGPPPLPAGVGGAMLPPPLPVNHQNEKDHVNIQMRYQSMSRGGPDFDPDDAVVHMNFATLKQDDVQSFTDLQRQQNEQGEKNMKFRYV